MKPIDANYYKLLLKASLLRTAFRGRQLQKNELWKTARPTKLLKHDLDRKKTEMTEGKMNIWTNQYMSHKH
jgi:hypothetical protein